MNKINRYLFLHFIGSFSSLFSTLFLIMSIIFFIQIARITSIISINLYELLKLYIFMLPRILIFTTPIAFFSALTIALFRLSKENESIVIFTFGYSPKKISIFFFKIATFLSIILLFISIIMMPLAENLKDNFIEYKKTQATINLKSSELGQKFGEWLLYIQDQEKLKNNTIYKNLVLYSPNSENQRLILAKSGEFKSANSVFEMILNDGKIYTISNTLHVTLFNKMTIRTKPSENLNDPKSILDYWRNAQKNISIYTLVSLFPLASVLFAISFGIVTYRYEKGFVYVGIFAVLFGYFTSMMLLAKYPKIAIPSVFLIFFLASIYYFKNKILKKY
ncbi:LptF/LptG family permease [Campylobacter sp. FMV-PI01]|uniref:LptF/LptG family permease n=1 Tax=Campylobacter portucalensis TaxID=2608384 RepID=A0A6L5WL97_9BACT|nr:LptF/LptG family permease [Campylobacter portucalensis]MSN97057.1 LptF/LptG family permease [Campylobacter portucalensis]